MRELPFGARLTDSFVEMLKWETLRARHYSPGVQPCLYTQEIERRVQPREQARRINFAKGEEIPGINRVEPPPASHVEVIKEHVWVLRFDGRTTRIRRALRHAAEVLRGRKHRSKTSFEIDDGLELHISERAQAQLKGSTIEVVNDSIVVTYGPH
ncbi:MAG TPA: hypothetical protein VLT36_00540 [Candidatus Dormibacteraeota bacterium]|nr:hypothetical protein [Candidatus Dormibacteraeota bacterium]